MGSSVSEVLSQKKKLLTDVLTMTQNVALDGGEADLERFAILMERREEVFAQLQELEESVNHADFNAENIKLAKEIKEIATEIITLDLANREYADKSFSELKKNMRQLSSEKNLNQGYYDNLPTNEGVYFDQKN